MTGDAHEVEIAAHHETVWRVWTDLARWPEWNSGVSRVTLLDDDVHGRDLRLGARVRVTRQHLPATIWEITGWEPPARWTWVTRQPGARLTVTRTVVLAENGPAEGGQRSVVTLSLEPSGPFRDVVRAVAGPLAHRLADRELHDLKARCERRTAGLR